MFRFRLQRVLELRARMERDAATALAAAEEQAEAAREEQERLQAARQVLAHHALANPASAASELTGGEESPAGDLSVGALRTLQFLLGRLDERVNAAASAAASAEDEVTQKQDALRAAFRDRRAIDRLKERAQESWRATETAADRQLMDEIALSRFTQAGAQKPGAAGPTTESTES